MTNNGTIVVGAVAAIALIFTIFMYFDSNVESTLEEVEVANKVHTHSFDEVVGISQSIEGVEEKVDSFTEIVERVEIIEKKIDAIENKVDAISEVMETDTEFSLAEVFERSEMSVVQVNVLRGGDGGIGSGFVYQ